MTHCVEKELQLAPRQWETFQKLKFLIIKILWKVHWWGNRKEWAYEYDHLGMLQTTTCKWTGMSTSCWWYYSLSKNQPSDMEIYPTPRRVYPTKRSWAGYMKPRCGINLISHGWLLDKYFILSKGNFKRNKTLKSLVMGYGEFIQWPSANQNTTNFLEVE